MTEALLVITKSFLSLELILYLTIGHSLFLLSSHIARCPFANDLSFDSMGHLSRDQMVAVWRAFGEGYKNAHDVILEGGGRGEDRKEIMNGVMLWTR